MRRKEKRNANCSHALEILRYYGFQGKMPGRFYLIWNQFELCEHSDACASATRHYPVWSLAQSFIEIRVVTMLRAVV